MVWRDIPGWPGYQINERGKLRTVHGYGMTSTKGGIYRLTRNGRSEKASGRELLALAFPPAPVTAKADSGPRQAAGTPRSPLSSVKATNNPNLRKCATCGKSTVNYRCSRCWKKIRGFGLDDARMSVYGE